jgi:alpha-mannosidase
MIVHMIGYSHLHPAGRWSLNTGKDEALATLRSAVERCEEYPGFRYSFGDIWAYQLVELNDPKLFKRIKKLIKRGQWAFPNGLYLNPHPELMSEKLWSQSVLFGHQYCIEKFGVEPKYSLQLDAARLPGSFLDSALDAGYRGMVFYNLGRPIDGMESSIFRWVDSKGRELLCYRLSPNYRTRSQELYGQIMEAVESGSLTLGHTLCFYGIGNHGGGPSKENIEYILANRDSFEGVELKFSTLEDFFSDALLMSDSFPEIRGDIGSPAAGYYSIRIPAKQKQRKAENALQQAQNVSDAWADKAQVRDFENKIEGYWNNLMMTGGHGPYSGSGIRECMEMVDLMQSRALKYAREWIYDVTRKWSRQHMEDLNFQQIVLFNTTNSDFDSWIEIEPNIDEDAWGERCLCLENGDVVPVQVLPNLSGHPNLTRLLFRVGLEAASCSRLIIREFSPLLERAKLSEEASKDSLRILKSTLENDFWTIRVGHSSINRIAASSDRDMNLLGKLGISLALYESLDGPEGLDFGTQPLAFCGGPETEGWTQVEKGPLRSALRSFGKIGESYYEWTIYLCRDDARIYNRLKLHVAEVNKAIRMNFQCAEPVGEFHLADCNLNDYLRSGRGEYPMHGWVKFGGDEAPFSIVSESISSVRINEGQLSLTFVRTPVVAPIAEGVEPTAFDVSDAGTVEFDWLITPATSPSDLKYELDQLRYPPVVLDRYEGMNRPPWQNTTPGHLREKNEIRALEDGLMQHLRNHD